MAWRTWRGFFVTDCNMSTEREGTQLCLLCVPSVVNYPRCWRTSAFKHCHCPSLHQGVTDPENAEGSRSPSIGWNRLSTAQKCKHCSPGSQRSFSPRQLNKPCLAWSWVGSCQTSHVLKGGCGRQIQVRTSLQKHHPWAVQVLQCALCKVPAQQNQCLQYLISILNQRPLFYSDWTGCSLGDALISLETQGKAAGAPSIIIQLLK